MKTLLTIAIVCAAVSPASAQPRAAMLETGSTGEASSIAPAFDRLARSRLEALAPMSMDAAPPLSLEDLQLAVGCVGESRECLSAVAERVGVDVMVVPSIEVTADVFVGSFLRIDVADGRVRRVTRQTQTEAELLDDVEPMLRELFDLPPMEESPDTGLSTSSSSQRGASSASSANDTELEDDRPFPVGPVIVAGVGVAAIVAGVISGVLSQNAQTSYAETPTDTVAGVNAAHDHLDTAERSAIAANVLIGVGAAAIVGAAAWWLFGKSSPFGVAASSDGVAMTFEGRWGGDS